MYFEYGIEKDLADYRYKNIRFHEPQFNKLKIYVKLKSKKYKIHLNQYEDFILFLKGSNITKDFADKNSKKQFKHWVNSIFIPKYIFSKIVLNRIKAKQIHFLCYYSEFNYALIAAAKKLNIKTVEMQHGPQTSIHLAYGSWSRVPKNGYSTLPQEFWSWDKISANVIKCWIKNNEHHKVRVVGHPWVDYWRIDNFQDKRFILYSLQPNPPSFEELFSKPILNLITQTKEPWLIRLHPRQLDSYDKIEELLRKNKIYTKSNLYIASHEPLPELLKKTKLHLTHFSGTTIEAAMFDVQTVLLHKIGLKSFPELIAQNKAFFLDSSEPNFHHQFISILKAQERNKKHKNTYYCKKYNFKNLFKF
ncbi:hypothetical protein [Mesonia sp. HuA40]|uniref:hypothetical protein n=1 Tax=Mesonia sp. HuA40 TaxID=2602761 RepID=UPI00164F55FD|nr:hypothetical protein [Mesonia sp. HuA40]